MRKHFYSFGLLFVMASVFVTSAQAAPPLRHDSIVIGDSIAQGLREACGLLGDTMVGRTPRNILIATNVIDAKKIKGKHVVLSTGLSNDPSKKDLPRQQINALIKAGAFSVTVLGVGTRADLAGVNELLASAAASAGATFVPLGRLAADQVHPENYMDLGNQIFTTDKCAGQPAPVPQ